MVNIFLLFDLFLIYEDMSSHIQQLVGIEIKSKILIVVGVLRGESTQRTITVNSACFVRLTAR